MSSVTRPAYAVLAVGLLWHPAWSSAQARGVRCSGSASLITTVFAEAKTILRAKTSVPPRLPNCVSGLNSADDTYAIVKSVNDSGYSVVLGATPGCEGQHVCSFGTMIGTTRPLDQVDEYDISRRPRSRVKLHGGFIGYFYAFNCGAYCSDSFVTWTEGNYHYVIGLKAESKANLLASVNSAIESGAAR